MAASLPARWASSFRDLGSGSVDCIVTPPFRSLQRRREIGRHAVSLEVTEENGSRVRGFKGFHRGKTGGAKTACLRVSASAVKTLGTLRQKAQGVGLEKPLGELT